MLHYIFCLYTHTRKIYLCSTLSWRGLFNVLTSATDTIVIICNANDRLKYTHTFLIMLYRLLQNKPTKNELKVIEHIVNTRYEVSYIHTVHVVYHICPLCRLACILLFTRVIKKRTYLPLKAERITLTWQDNKLQEKEWSVGYILRVTYLLYNNVVSKFRI
jgi:hypothetical protein